jgi:nucleoside-diphosphate-sugar epimerase
VKVVVFGATGVVGLAASRYFASVPGCEVVGASRRAPDAEGVVHVALDLTDGNACEAAIATDAFAGVSHVVYAALQERPGLVAGWRDRDLMARNLAMFRNALDPLVSRHGDSLEHVSLLQGAKAYGVHLDSVPIPAREHSPRHPHENFYFLQEDHLRQAAGGAAWSWTILRPQVVYGESFASPMNLIPALGVYGALLREDGLPLSFPGGLPRVSEAVDADLLARALGWAATDPAARDEIFNVTNGDVFVWHHVWPAIADALGMDVGEPHPIELAEEMPARADEWAAIVDRYALRAPRDLHAFVGDAWRYADLLFGYGADAPRLPALLSTVKIRRAGFAEWIDTEDMFRKWLERFQERRLLPPRKA